MMHQNPSKPVRSGRSHYRQTVIFIGHNATELQLYTRNSIRPISTRHNSTRPQLDTRQLDSLQLDTPQFDTSLLDTTQLYTPTTRHNTWPQIDIPQLYTDHMAVRLQQLQSSERYKQWYRSYPYFCIAKLLRLRFVRNIRYSIVASTLRPCGLCRVVACRVLTYRAVSCPVMAVSSCAVTSCDMSS